MARSLPLSVARGVRGLVTAIQWCIPLVKPKQKMILGLEPSMSMSYLQYIQIKIIKEVREKMKILSILRECSYHFDRSLKGKTDH